MPGGVDMHCHIAGPKVNSARKMRPEDKRKAEKIVGTSSTRSGTMGSVPSTFATGYKYAGMGYTTAFDAAIPPLAARHVHEEFEDTPCIDKGFFVLMATTISSWSRSSAKSRRNSIVHRLVVGSGQGLHAEGRQPRRRLNLEAAAERNFLHGWRDVAHFNVTPRQSIEQIARAVDEMRLPHSRPPPLQQSRDAWQLAPTLETMKTFGDSRGPSVHTSSFTVRGGGRRGDERRSTARCRNWSSTWILIRT